MLGSATLAFALIALLHTEDLYPIDGVSCCFSRRSIQTLGVLREIGVLNICADLSLGLCSLLIVGSFFTVQG